MPEKEKIIIKMADSSRTEIKVVSSTHPVEIRKIKPKGG